MNYFLRKVKEDGEKRFGEQHRIEEEAYIPAEDLNTYFDIPFSSFDGTELFADIYRTKRQRPGALAVAVMVHGGGLFIGTRRNNRAFCEILARKGFLVFSLEYRLIDKADGFSEISDIYAGLDFVREHLGEYGGDSQRVFIFGESAGAWLSVYAAAALREENLRRLFCLPEIDLSVKGMVGLSGMYYTTRRDPIGMIYRRDLFGIRRRDRGAMEWMNPENEKVVSALPPMLLTSSGNDFLKSYTLRYARALKRQGHPCRLLFYPEGKELTHAFPSLCPDLPESREVLSRILAWVRKDCK